MVAMSSMKDLKDLEAGYCLSPREEELVEYYLWTKNHTPDQGGKWIIPEFDINSVEPQQLIHVFNEMSLINSNGEECFFFHKPVIDHVRNCVSRKVAGDKGYWKQTGKERQSQTDKYKWSRHIFSYQPKQESSEHTCWVMYEFRLEDYPSYVLCRITKKLKKKPKVGSTSSESHQEANTEGRITKKLKKKRKVGSTSGESHQEANVKRSNLTDNITKKANSHTRPSQNDNHTPLEAANSETLVHANALEVPTIMTPLDWPSHFQMGDHEFQTLNDLLKSFCHNLDNFHVDMSPSESTIEAHVEPLDICVADYGIY